MARLDNWMWPNWAITEGFHLSSHSLPPRLAWPVHVHIHMGESFPSSDGFPSLPLSLVIPLICADLHLKNWGGGAGTDYIVQLLRSLFCGCNQVMFQRNAAVWNQIILSDSNIVLILKGIMILQLFSLVLTSNTHLDRPLVIFIH